MAVDLWIITGFLGSGKTTVLNHLLDTSSTDTRIGVLVNDFGELGIDARLLRTRVDAQAGDSPDGAAPADIIELNGGQIFCSCLSGSFVDSLVALVEKSVDAILVEGSGLAKPRPMSEIVSQAISQTGGQLRHRGTICVVDAGRFTPLRTVVNAVDEQVYFADAVVVNKVDTVDRETVRGVHMQVSEVNARATVLDTSFGRVSLAEIEATSAVQANDDRRTAPRADGEVAPADGNPSPAQAARRQTVCDTTAAFKGWNGPGRPVAVKYEPGSTLSRGELENLLPELLHGTFRAKGFLRGPHGDWYVSAVGEAFTIDALPGNGRQYGLTIIGPADVRLPERVDHR